MIAYADGVEARKGDHVDSDGYLAVVEAIVDSESQRAEWGLAERGLMLKTEAFGLMFEPLGSSSWETIVLIRRLDPDPKRP